jgi:hypothetical protein
MLNEQLELIYISEDINKILSQIKSKGKSISAAAKTGNILKLNRSFEGLPDLSTDQVTAFARKKIGSDFKSSEKYVNSKMKKAPERIKDIITIAHSSLNSIKKQSDDQDVLSEVDTTLKKLDAMLDKAKGMVFSEGISLMFLAMILSIFVSSTSVVVLLINAAGFIGVLAGLFLYAMSILLKIFIETKKAGDKAVK